MKILNRAGVAWREETEGGDGERGGKREQLAAVVCQLFEAYKGLRWLEALKQQEKQLP